MWLSSAWLENLHDKVPWALHEVNLCAITAYRVCSSCCFLIFWWEWEAGSCQEKSRFFLVGFRSPPGLIISRILFIIFKDKTSSSSQGIEGVRLGGLRSSAFVVLSGWPAAWFATDWKAAGISFSSSKSEAIVLKSKMMEYPLQVRDQLLPQQEDLKYPVILFTSEGRVN